jgi:hypothetical protein
MKFKVGDIVSLRKHDRLSRGYGAEPGMRAKVTEVGLRIYGSYMVNLIWLDKTTQRNGAYLTEDFELIDDNGQLLFNFMYEKV